MTLTPARIKASWAAIVGAYDQVLGEPDRKSFLIDDSGEPSPYQNTIDALEGRRRDAPEFFEGGAYDWAFDPEAYEFPMEAAFQVRCLDAAIGLWKAELLPRDEAKAALSRIVARTTFLTNFHEGTPFVRHQGGIDFIVCPLAWPDVCFWHFSGFAASLSSGPIDTMPPSAMWSLVLDPPVPPIAAQARPYWVTILANIVASVGCSNDLLMTQATREIGQNVPAFAEAMPENRFGLDAPMSNDLAYLAVEMALAHEVGHVFSGDHRNVLQDPDERRADLLAHGAFVNSAGWRAWCLEGSGLSDLGKISAGLLAFGEVMRTLVTVRALVAERILDPKVSASLMSNAEELMARGERGAVQLDNYLAWAIRENRWPQRAQDEAIFQGLLERLGLYSLDFIRFVKAFPAEAIAAALQVARHQQLE